MNIRRIRAIAEKEMIHILRDTRSLIMAIAIPLLLLFLFGYALTLDVNDVPLAVFDMDGTQLSERFVDRFAKSKYFSLRLVATNYREIPRISQPDFGPAGTSRFKPSWMEPIRIPLPSP